MVLESQHSLLDSFHLAMLVYLKQRDLTLKDHDFDWFLRQAHVEKYWRNFYDMAFIKQPPTIEEDLNKFLPIPWLNHRLRGIPDE